MRALYNSLLWPLRLAASVGSRIAARSPGARREWDERLARVVPDTRPGAIWLHGASVGEARIVSTLAARLRAEDPDRGLVVSAYTPAGRARLPEMPGVDAAFYCPLDFRAGVARVLAALRPAALVLVETELWPNLVAESATAGVPVVVLNGRLAPRRMARYRRLSGLYRPLLGSLTRLGVQSEEDAKRFLEIGAPPERTTVTGNVKYDLPLPEESSERLRNRLGLAAERPVFVAGSTARGEEHAALDALEMLRRTVPEALLVLAPRHLERTREVARLVEARRLRLKRLSGGGSIGPADNVLLVDTHGELSGLYQLARVAFVGGSLVPVGGHNVLEPASVGVPVLFGPRTENFAEPAAALERAAGGKRVRDAAELGTALVRLMTDRDARESMAERALSVVAANRGAVERSLQLVRDAIEHAGPATEAAGP